MKNGQGGHCTVIIGGEPWLVVRLVRGAAGTRQDGMLQCCSRGRGGQVCSCKRASRIT